MGRIAALYVMGQDVIASLPWDEWWNFELSEDDANPHIALLPLHPMFELNPTRLLHGKDEKEFENTRSVKEGKDEQGKEDKGVVNSFEVGTDVKTTTRFVGSSFPDILVEVERRGSSFAELLTISEQDDWIYADGNSTSCVARHCP
ncbi:hypothetical protein Tco_0732652 [Tanacetum coccineum]